MTAWYAINARQLLDARRQGMTPAGQVVVSLVGGDFPGCTALYLRPDMPADRLDWRMLVNLPVWVWANGRAPLDWLVTTTARIAQARPRELLVRFEQPREVLWTLADKQHTEVIETHDVEVGTGEHRAAIADIPGTHEFTWAPIRLSPTNIAAGLQNALRAKHTFRTTL